MREPPARSTAKTYGRALLGLGQSVGTVVFRGSLLAIALISGGLGAIREITNWTSPDIHIGHYRLNIYFLVAIFALLWVQFAAWQDEQQRVKVLTQAKAELEERLKDKADHAAVLERLSHDIEFGKLELFTIELAARDWLEQVERVKGGGEKDEDRLRASWDQASDAGGSWERSTKKYITRFAGSALGPSLAARFADDAGLTPRQPAFISDETHFVERWQHVEMRLQRLQEIAQELRQLWN